MPDSPLKRALLVEDDWQVAEVLKATMVDEGWTVDVAHTRAKALVCIHEHAPYTLVLLDLRLPDGDGLSLTLDVRKRDASTEVAVVTGYGAVPEAVQAMRLGARDFLAKPVVTAELRALLDRAFTRVALRRGPEEEKAERIGRMFDHITDRLSQVEAELRTVKHHAPTGS